MTSDEDIQCDSSAPSVSGDGRFVAYQTNESTSSAGVPSYEVYLRDTATGTTDLVSDSGDGGGNGSSRAPAISQNGAIVAFESDAGNLAGGAPNSTDVFARVVAEERTELISVAPGGATANGHSFAPAVSANGSVVAFESERHESRRGRLAGDPQRLCPRPPGRPHVPRLDRRERLAGHRPDRPGRDQRRRSDRRVRLGRTEPRRVDARRGRGARIRRGLRPRPRQRRDDPDLRGKGRRTGRSPQRPADDRPRRTHGRVRVQLAEPRPRRRQPGLRHLPARPAAGALDRAGSDRLRAAAWRRGRSAGRRGRHERRMGFAPGRGGDAQRPGGGRLHDRARRLQRRDAPPRRVVRDHDPRSRLPRLAIARATLAVDHNGPRPPLTAGLQGVGTLTPPPSGPPGNAQVKIEPPVGRPGIVVIVTGTGFRPNAQLALTWSRGLTPKTPTVIVDGTGSFRAQMLVFHNDFIGPRDLVVTSVVRAVVRAIRDAVPRRGVAERAAAVRARRSGGEPSAHVRLPGLSAMSEADDPLSPLRHRQSGRRPVLRVVRCVPGVGGHRGARCWAHRTRS